MTYFTPNNQEDLQKLKELIEKKKDLKKLYLNRKIKKKTLDFNLADIYAPITKNQSEQTKNLSEQTKIIKEGQQNQLKAIQDQTDQIKALTAPTIETEAIAKPAIESSASEDEFHDPVTQSIDNDISIALDQLLLPKHTLPNFKFKKVDFNNYTVNDRPFKIVDREIDLNGNIFEITPEILQMFMTGNKINYKQFTDNEKNLLLGFVRYAGDIGNDKRSNLSDAVRYWKSQINLKDIDDLQGNGISYVFLSGDPNILVNRLEVLIGEFLAGNKNSISEADAILKELLNQNEINDSQYKNAMSIFTS